MSNKDKQVEKVYPKAPPGIRVLSNGAGFDEGRRRIVHGPGTYSPDTSPITKANASAYATKRWLDAAAAVDSALIDRSGSTTAGLRAMAAAQLQIAIDPKDERNATKAANWILKAGNYTKQAETAQTGDQDAVSLSALRAVLDVIKEVRAAGGRVELEPNPGDGGDK